MKKLIPLILGRYINLMSHIAPRYAAALGFRMFCFPFRGALKPYQLEFLNGATQSTLVHKGQEIKIYKWNNGPRKILLLHGWQSHSFRWKNYLENFPGDEFTIYSIDAPGHGLSSGNFLTVPLYSEVIEKFIIEHGAFDSIISHSLGSFTSLYTLYRLPSLPVQKLVLLASPGEATEFVAFYKKSLRLSDRAMTNISIHFEKAVGHPVEFFNASKFAVNLRIPGLIIHDQDDDETPFHHSVAIHKAWKRSELVLTKGLTHNLKSREIIERVSSFVRSAQPATILEKTPDMSR